MLWVILNTGVCGPAMTTYLIHKQYKQVHSIYYNNLEINESGKQGNAMEFITFQLISGKILERIREKFLKKLSLESLKEIRKKFLEDLLKNHRNNSVLPNFRRVF